MVSTQQIQITPLLPLQGYLLLKTENKTFVKYPLNF